MNLFVYGTLIDPALLDALIGRRPRRTSAILYGYRKILRAHRYPAIQPDPIASVHGCILHDLDAETLRRLDAYEDEGRLYVRQTVLVMAGGHPRPCMTYVGL